MITFLTRKVRGDHVFIGMATQGGCPQHPNSTNKETEVREFKIRLKESDSGKIWRNQNLIYCPLELSEGITGNKVEQKACRCWCPVALCDLDASLPV